jgi:CHAT domain-containing protein
VELVNVSERKFPTDLAQDLTSDGHLTRSEWVVLWLRSVRSSRSLAATTFLILLAIVGWTIWRLFIYQSELEKALSGLAGLYERARPIRARTTALPYAPFLENIGVPDQTPDHTELERIKTRLFLASTPGHPASDHALGLFYLTQHDYENAIPLLKSAVLGKPNRAEFYNDLGAAILERAHEDRERSGSGVDARDNSIEEFDESLSNFRRALELDPHLSEAMFNRSLCHQDMYLPFRIRDDWREYVETDPSSGWADEARERIQELDDRATQNDLQAKLDPAEGFLDAFKRKDDTRAWQILGAYRDINGSRIENELLDSYIEDRIEGRSAEAAHKFKVLKYAADLESRIGHDRFMTDLAKWHSRAKLTGEVSVAEARKQIRAADVLFIDQNRFPEALSLYEKAKLRFQQVDDSAEATFATYRAGHCNVRLSTPTVTAVFELLMRDTKKRGYSWLTARCFGCLAEVYFRLGEYSNALHCSSRALDLLTDTGDRNGIIRALYQLADEERRVGKRAEALACLRRALGLTNEPGVQVRNVSAVCTIMGVTCGSLGLLNTALEYHKQALDLALKSGSKPLYVARPYAHIGLLQGKLNLFEESLRSLESSVELARTLRDQTGQEMLAYSALVQGEVYRLASRFDDAISSFDLAAQSYRELDAPAYVLEASKGKFFTLVARGDDRQAEAELGRAIALYEEYRTKIREESNKDGFFDDAQDVYDLGTDFQYTRTGDKRAALDLAETSRARSFNDLVNGRGRLLEAQDGPDLIAAQTVSPLSVEQIQHRMAVNCQVVEYAVLPDKTVAWVLSNDSLEAAASVISSTDLSDMVMRYVESLADASQGEREADKLGEDLYDALIAPIRPYLKPGKQVCIVPDKFLNYLPFQALRSRSSGAYLLEDFVLKYSPSLNTYLHCSEEATAKSIAADERLLIVGNPSFNPLAFPNLSDLSGAEREAIGVCDYYPNHCKLVDRFARKQAVMSMMGEASVIEFATHCVVDQMSPMRSCIVLAEDGGATSGKKRQDGEMQAAEIYRTKLPRAKLVVLSACRTAIERCLKGEGAIGMARPFMIAGAPSVVASLWPVNSDSAADLMIDFHRLRTAGDKPVPMALREAELNMLRNPNGRFRSPWHWAAFIVVGG